nr:caspase family protein [Bacteroidota bacterium]
MKTETIAVQFETPKHFFARSVDFDADYNNVVVAGKCLTKKKTNNILIYNSMDGSEIANFEGTADDISDIKYSNDGTHILSIGTKIQLWIVNSNQNVKTVDGNAKTGYYGPTGRYGVFGIRKNIYLWDFVNDSVVYEINAHDATVTSVAISPDGKFLLSSCKNGVLKLWDFQSGKNIPHFKGRKADKINKLVISGDDRFLYTVVDDKKVQYWDFDRMKLNFLTIESQRSNQNFTVKSIDFDPGGKYAVITPDLVKGVFIYDIEKQEKIRFLKNTSYLNNAIYSSTGKYIAAGGNDNKIVIWNPDNEEPAFKLSGHISNINSLRFSKDDNFLFSGGDDKTLKYWDVMSRSLICSVPTKYYVNSIAICPDEKYILTACGNKQDVFRKNATELVEWDRSLLSEYNKKEPVVFPKYFTGHTYPVMDAVYNSDGTVLASCSVDNSIIIWDKESGNILHELEGHSSTVNSLAFTHDDKTLISGGSDALIKLWNVEGGKNTMNILTFDNGEDYIFFTPDHYYSCTRDGIKNVHFELDNNIYLFEQFDLRLNRPDIIAGILPHANQSLVNAYNKAYQKRLHKMGFTLEMLGTDFHIPKISITNSESIPYFVNDPAIQLEIEAKDDLYKLNRINVWINDVPVFGMKGIDLSEENANSITKTIELELSKGNNKIQVSSLNEKGAESVKQDKFVYCDVAIDKCNLYVIAIGVSEFENDAFNLGYAAKDAINIVEIFQGQQKKYNNIYTTIIQNDEATRENIIGVKEVLLDSKVDDIVILFVATHGLLDENLNYYLATSDIDFYHPSRKGLAYEELENILDGIPARKKLLLIDACHSGEVDDTEIEFVDNTSDLETDNNSSVKSRGFKRIADSGLGVSGSFELMKELFADLRRGSGAVVISSAGGKEYAYESQEWNNGVFTYSLLEGLKTNKADLNDNGSITISEMRDYIFTNVQKLTNGKQNPSARRENLVDDYTIW